MLVLSCFSGPVLSDTDNTTTRLHPRFFLDVVHDAARHRLIGRNPGLRFLHAGWRSGANRAAVDHDRVSTDACTWQTCGACLPPRDVTSSRLSSSFSQVRVCRAQKLKKVQIIGKQDPYVRAKLLYNGHKVGRSVGTGPR